ncbi:dihydroorotate dehydrogenase [Clathrus columnatus]|uniref:Orotidine 5'-phosphate decarboxylase n=1 Tax=Clathrus columnatus TaxID=1419009 RepID=A0AAV5A2N2_9AGAM|nr:dihydroorotate dehydrogenase [Clathrus columnatus]
MSRLSYGHRVELHSNSAAKALLSLMERKKTNLCVSVDVTSKASFLTIIDAVGPDVCLVKTHIDIIEDFDQDLITKLQELSAKHDFLIFEDRKFADIGNTVALQYSQGVHKIASWAHITNAHPVPGPGIIAGLGSVGHPLGRGLLLLSEMSTKGNLATGLYTESAVEMARQNRDFVIGFIAMSRDSLHQKEKDDSEDFLILTPGVGLDTYGDTMGQQYKTPYEVVFNRGCDVIIVGRGIYGDGKNIDISSVQTQAKRFRQEGWNAYLKRIDG